MEMCKYAVIDMDRATYLHSDFPGVHGSRWKSKKPFPRSAQAMCQEPEILTWVGRYLVRLRAYLGSLSWWSGGVRGRGRGRGMGSVLVGDSYAVIECTALLSELLLVDGSVG